jgi:hypothetical protein
MMRYNMVYLPYPKSGFLPMQANILNLESREKGNGCTTWYFFPTGQNEDSPHPRRRLQQTLENKESDTKVKEKCHTSENALQWKEKWPT